MKSVIAIVFGLLVMNAYASKCEAVKEAGFSRANKGMTHFRNARAAYKDAQEFAKDNLKTQTDSNLKYLCDKLEYTFFQAKKCQEHYAASVLYYESVEQHCSDKDFRLANENITDMTQNVDYCQDLMRKSKTHFHNGCNR